MRFAHVSNLSKAIVNRRSGFLALFPCWRYGIGRTKFCNLRTHRSVYFFYSRPVRHDVPNPMGPHARNPEHGSLDAPSQHYAVGHEFVAHGLPHRFDQVYKIIFFARIDGVHVPEGERLRLRLLRGTRNARQ